jgi:hypothetical protein
MGELVDIKELLSKLNKYYLVINKLKFEQIIICKVSCDRCTVDNDIILNDQTIYKLRNLKDRLIRGINIALTYDIHFDLCKCCNNQIIYNIDENNYNNTFIQLNKYIDSYNDYKDKIKLLLLLDARYSPNSPFYKEKFPLDTFKIIWHLVDL